MPIASDRVLRRLSDLGTNPVAAALSGGLERTYISDIVSGRKKQLNGVGLHKLALALECAPAFLTGEQDDLGAAPEGAPETSARATRASRDPDALPIAGMIEPGVFRTAAAAIDPGATARLARDLRYPGLPQAAYIVAGDAYAAARLPNGAVVTTVDADAWQAENGPLPIGRRVVVRRTVNAGGMVGTETSVFAVAGSGRDRRRLVPIAGAQGDSIELPIREDEPGDACAAVAIVGFVVRASIDFDR